jgi:hypothetical protein
VDPPAVPPDMPHTRAAAAAAAAAIAAKPPLAGNNDGGLARTGPPFKACAAGECRGLNPPAHPDGVSGADDAPQCAAPQEWGWVCGWGWACDGGGAWG